MSKRGEAQWNEWMKIETVWMKGEKEKEKPKWNGQNWGIECSVCAFVRSFSMAWLDHVHLTALYTKRSRIRNLRWFSQMKQSSRHRCHHHHRDVTTRHHVEYKKKMKTNSTNGTKTLSSSTSSEMTTINELLLLFDARFLLFIWRSHRQPL